MTTTELHTENLTLRRLVSDDIESFVRFMTDENAVRYMPFPPEQKTREGASSMIEWVMGSYDTKNAVFVMAITRKGDDAYIGSTGANSVEDSDAIEFFYTLLPEYWGQGYGTEAARRIVRYLFEEVNAPRVVANVFPDNIPSVRVLEKLGFQRTEQGEQDGMATAVYALTVQDYGQRE